MRLNRDAHCRNCDLWEQCQTVCVPARRFAGHFPPASPASRCLLIIGEAPGYQEDTEGRCWIGPAGQTLRKLYIQDVFGFDRKCDVYLTNSVRCRPPGNSTPTARQLKACRPYLLDDFRVLSSLYKEFWVLCCGATGAAALGFSSLKSALASQGQELEVEGARVRVFSTYHPAYLFRNPSAAHAVEAHLRLLANAMDGAPAVMFEPDIPALTPTVPDYPLTLLSLDIETYGAVRSLPPQRHFHPRKSEAYDGVSKRQMIQTVGITWPDQEGVLWHGVFPRSRGLTLIGPWLRKLVADGGWLIGQNLQFDLGYLRYCCPETRAWLCPPLRLIDLSVTNYLHSEARPERSLKTLAPLFNITKYGASAAQRFYSDMDPELWRYNCQDTAATLMLQAELEDAIRSYYGPETGKLSESCRAWYSDLLWLVLWMSEAGVAMSESGLQTLLSRYTSRRDKLTALAEAWWNMPLKGEGSESAKREAVKEACDLLGDAVPDDLVRTPKTQRISFCEQNRSALLTLLPKDSSAARKLRVMGRYSQVSKLLDSYVVPLLVGRGTKNEDPSTRLLHGVVYPRWFPVPSQFDDGGEGGTIQSRVVCKQPAIQTFPKPIKKRITCRFPGGRLLWFDYSQIELRVAALLSGDEPLMKAYTDGIKLHDETAKLIFGADIVSHRSYQSVYRHAGKTLNFLMLYRGGAMKFRETLMRDVGLDLDAAVCERAIRLFWTAHPQLRRWQDDLIRQAKRNGCVELPITGQSRLFLGGGSAVSNQINEICNFPVQATAANIMLSAQFALWSELKRRGLRSLVPLNIYDAAVIEVYPNELTAVLAVMADVLPTPPYLRQLCDLLQRKVPIEYECTLDDGGQFRYNKEMDAPKPAKPMGSLLRAS